MRTVLVSALWLAICGHLAGCNSNDGFFGPGSGYDFCEQDSDCASGDVCARSSACFPKDQVRPVAVVWTVDGQPASADACADHKSFTLQFFSQANGYGFGYAPVPCVAGKFSVDKMPSIIDFVEMYDDGSNGASGQIVTSTTADDPSQAALDLKLSP